MVCVEFSWPSVFSSSEWSRYVCEAATFVFTTQIALVESVALRCFRIEHYALHIQTHNFSNTSFSLKVPPPAAGLLHRRGATVVARKVGTGLEGSGASTRLRKKYEVVSCVPVPVSVRACARTNESVGWFRRMSKDEDEAAITKHETRPDNGRGGCPKETCCRRHPATRETTIIRSLRETLTHPHPPLPKLTKSEIAICGLADVHYGGGHTSQVCAKQ